MFENVTLPAGDAYFVNIKDISGANLTPSNDGGLEVMSANRHGGFGVTVSGLFCKQYRRKRRGKFSGQIS